mmetsp:Transcript_42188/g.92478  ORF Transcript_42188/g.92478 Transcript_42188/m.92478 type:complete len:257 (-) Transcript_42188:46-816(-)
MDSFHPAGRSNASLPQPEILPAASIFRETRGRALSADMQQQSTKYLSRPGLAATARLQGGQGALIASSIQSAKRGPASVQATPYVWQDLATGKYHMVDNHSGRHVACTADGKPLRSFKPGISGTARPGTRSKLLDKDAAWEAYLSYPIPARAPPLDPIHRQERVATKGRFGTQPTCENVFFLKEQQRQKLMFPEREKLAREEEERAKNKIDELHQNFLALAASCDINAKTSRKERQQSTLSKSEQWAFTATGLYRP